MALANLRYINVLNNNNNNNNTVAHTRLPSEGSGAVPVLCSQPAGDVSHKPGSRLPSLSARAAVTPATLNRAATSFAAW